MRNLYTKHHWFGRLLASDPGRVRFQKAGKATISLISSVFTTLFILNITGNSLLTASIVSGMIGMMGIMIVLDDTKKKKQVTTLLMAISAAAGVTFGAILSGNAYYIDVLMILIIFSSFYFSRFGVRYFSICMIGFITVYFSSVLKLPINQLPWFYMGISIGVIYAFFYNFILFQDSAQVLKKSMRSFHIQSNLTFNILIGAIQDTKLDPKRIKSLEKNILKLREYARTVSGDLKEQEIKEIWPGLKSSQLQLYVFDTGMFLETLTDSIYSLKKANALEIEKLRRLLVWVITSLRDAEVLAPSYDNQNLMEAEKAIQALRFVLIDLLKREEQPSGWVFLIRRIESIGNHVIEGAINIQQSLNNGKKVNDEIEEKEEDESKDEDSSNELKPTTKKAYQALVAGILSIIVGQTISPTQPYWVLLTAFIVLLGTESIGRTYKKGFERSFGTIIGAVLGFILAKLLSGHSVIELTLLFTVIFAAFYLVTVSYTLMSMFITMLIAFMYDILLGGITFMLIGARVIDTIAGAAIALGVSSVIFPKRTRDKVADAFEDYLTELKPYVTLYVKSFRENINVNELRDSAFEMDKNLQSIKDEADPLLQRSEALSQTGINRWITIFTAINYYARHLVASSYKKKFEYPKEIEEVFKKMEEKLDHNIDTLGKLIKGTETFGTIYNLKEEREQIERLAPSRNQSHHDLIHHLYYVWRINQSIVALGIDFGAEKK
ncbi:FUSC family protein [Virgibacillus ndiopensis]|uniref:FUSC family protein n=1 Tax=Virgibacillus ndiopensis TaxID=2004408 RepID=UPI000C0703C5|nr:FUSC family protein [Virgibacillus ndiopensis]